MFDINYLNNRWVVIYKDEILTREKVMFMFNEDFYYENLDNKNLRLVIMNYQVSIGSKDESITRRMSNFLDSQLVLKSLLRC